MPWVGGSKLFLIFVYFVVQKLSTMKSTKSLKETLILVPVRESLLILSSTS